MSQLDDDLYGDLYGADDNEFVVKTEPELAPPEDVKSTPTEEESPTAPFLAASTIPVAQTPSTVETKPVVPSFVPKTASPTPAAIPTVVTTSPTSIQIAAPPPVSNGTPYSTQVAQQYSAYHHSEVDYPSERSEIPKIDTTGERSQIHVVDRSVRPSEMRDEGKMFVGGLNWDTTDDTLRQYFSQFGKVDACTIMRDASGRSRGFAFLTFEDPAAVNAVMVREHYLDGKIIDPKRAIPRQEHNRTQKVFVGGLAPSVTNESMRNFFSQFGKVIDATVMIDRDSSRSKGFGFVTFDDKTDVEHLIGLGGLDIEGKVVEVKLAQPRGAQIASQTTFTRDGYQGGHGMQGAAGGFGQQAAAVTTAGQTPFDPQALAQLYQRMFQFSGGGGGFGAGMNPMMGGGMGMNPMMGGGPAMGMGMGMGGYGRGMGGPGMMMGGNMGMGRGAMGAASMNPNIPRGPRGAGPPTGPAAQSGVGPHRTAGGQHRFHPYGR